MFCPECETEYREGFTVCADCGVDLVAQLGAAELVPLTHERETGVVDAILYHLERDEVPYVIEAGTAMRLLDGQVEQMDTPDLWQARIWVTRAKVDVAKELMAEARAEYAAQKAQQE